MSKRHIIVDGKKPCTTCRDLKPLTEFYKSAENPCGLTYGCKKCLRKKNKQYQQSETGRATHLAAQLNYLETPKGKAAAARALAKRISHARRRRPSP